ncbi:MAG: hypothetical protein Q9215_005236 [Flavoplaca cf. flavocitrina]
MERDDRPSTATANVTGSTPTIRTEAIQTPASHPFSEPRAQIPSLVEVHPSMLERGRPEKKVGSPFFEPWSAPEPSSRRRVQKPKISMTTSVKDNSPVPLDHCSSRRSAASFSTAQTTDGQRSSSVADKYRDWVPFIATPPTPSKSQDGDEQTSLPDRKSRGSHNLSRLGNPPSRRSHWFSSAHDMDDEQVIPSSALSASFSAPGFSYPKFHGPSDSLPREGTPNPPLQPSAPPDRDFEQAKSVFSPDGYIPAGRRPIDIQRSMSDHSDYDQAHRIGDWVANSHSQPGFPSTESVSPPPAIIETLKGSAEPLGSNPSRFSSLSAKGNNHEQPFPGDDRKPASTAASLNRPRNEYRHPTVSEAHSRLASPSTNHKPSRQDFKERLLNEAMAWSNLRPADVKNAICFDSTKPFKPWSASAMREETIRREHFVLTKKILDSKPTPVFGTAKWYQLDRLRCWTNLNCHYRRVEVRWPPEYVPRYVEEAKKWDPEADFSAVSETGESACFGDEDEGMEGDESLGDGSV